MDIFSDTLGQGPDLIMLHGWGLHGHVWQHTAAALASDWRVTLMDLPGHGRSDLPSGPLTLDSLSAALAQAAPLQGVWMGWSLGGMFALHQAIHRPERVTKLILVAASPQFVCAPDWPHAMRPALLEEFAQSLEQDFHGTLQRFLALQTHGSAAGAKTLRELRRQARDYPEPRAEALGAGLALLQQVNLRPYLQQVHCPTLLIYGQRDLLVPKEAGYASAALLPHAQVHVMAGAGHAPFLSHPQEFLEVVQAFIHA